MNRLAFCCLVLTITMVGWGCREAGEAPDQTPEEPAKSARAPAPAPESSAAQPEHTAPDSGGSEAGAAGAMEAPKTRFVSSFQASSDPLLKEIGQEIAKDSEQANEALDGQASLQDQLGKVVESLAGGKDAEAVGLYSKLAEAKLTPDQEKVMADLKDAINAYVVQRNFSGLTDADTELGKVVTALRQGDTTTALAQLQQMTSRVSLSPEQKNLLNQLVESYAPGLKDAGKALQEGLKDLNPLQQ